METSLTHACLLSLVSLVGAPPGDAGEDWLAIVRRVKQKG